MILRFSIVSFVLLSFANILVYQCYSFLITPEIIPPRRFASPSSPSDTTTFLSSKTGGNADQSSSLISPIPIEWQGQVLKSLKSVVDPDLGQDIVTLGFIKNLTLDESSRTVSFDVELTTPACPVKDQFQKDCERLVLELPFVSSVEVQMTAQPSLMETSTLGMTQVGAVIAVSSCKGGVGKSTTAVNLAYALQSLGATVGIFDADVYGPSLPTMIEPDDDVVRFVGRQIAPLQRNGVRLMSFGYVNDGSAVMRGPMVTQLLDQFLSVTHWGSLDYLILDMPPGTGDIQLTLTQRLNITAAVIVTTPQELSFADVVRGVEMFDSVNVPCVAVVENMAYYEVDAQKQFDSKIIEQAMENALLEKGILEKGGSSLLAKELVQVILKSAKAVPVRIFGPGHKRRLSEQWGIEHTFSMPLMDQIAANGDSGTPFVLAHPDSPQTKIYRDLASSVVSEVAKAKFSSTRPIVSYDEDNHLIHIDNDTMAPAALRRACRCAACVEELTGRQILKPSDVKESIKPLKMYSTGNYAHSVDWSDGHRSLYPYRQIKTLLQLNGGISHGFSKANVSIHENLQEA
ncbi:chromosome partitioning ATPase Mrp [Nitzschia inconspicua]|uniref:Chromosome partitioning ATPase Mrp n=1 Tax=Nitzschia inconspicua TaxID=303405 RepID=A0A9K3LII2_9STRA|nr:chromosome partitioning ATPase Mrp [Nitzschia inconspicua]